MEHTASKTVTPTGRIQEKRDEKQRRKTEREKRLTEKEEEIPRVETDCTRER